MICFKFDIEWIKAQRNAEVRVGSGINSVFLLLQFSKNLKHLRYTTLVIMLSKWWLHHHCSFCFDIRRNIFLVIFFYDFPWTILQYCDSPDLTDNVGFPGFVTCRNPEIYFNRTKHSLQRSTTEAKQTHRQMFSFIFLIFHIRFQNFLRGFQ